jgi:excisionase family DNA binding protein
MTRNEIEPLMTVKDVAEYLQIAEKTVRNRVHRNEIPYVKAGAALRFRRAEIDQWIIMQTAAADEAA